MDKINKIKYCSAYILCSKEKVTAHFSTVCSVMMPTKKTLELIINNNRNCSSSVKADV